MNTNKEILINKISTIYKKNWQEYDRGLLVEQLKELDDPPKNSKSLSCNEIIDLLVEDDMKKLAAKSFVELESELKFQSMY